MRSDIYIANILNIISALYYRDHTYDYVGLLRSMLPWRVTPLIYTNLSMEGCRKNYIREANILIMDH